MEQTTTGISPELLQTLIIITLVTIPFKGLALWKAAHRERKGWFVALLVFNTMGILDIVYYFFLDQKEHVRRHKNSSK